MELGGWCVPPQHAQSCRVCESPESDAELRQIFADLDAVIRTEPLVGAYDQTL